MKKVLLIEDDEVIRENAAEILSLSQFEVKAAKNGKEGVLLAKDWLPDVIVCDIMMPELDGYAVLHVLSKDPMTSEIPFIFLTAKVEGKEIRKGMELGADDYLTKPFDEMDLVRAIETRLRKKEMSEKRWDKRIKEFDGFIDDVRSKATFEDTIEDFPEVKYQKKQVIFHEGDLPEFVFLIRNGKIKISKNHVDGKELVTRILSRGDFFGFTAMIEGHNYSESAVALDDVLVRKIPKKDFLNLLYGDPALSNRFIKILTKEVEEKEAQVLSIAYDTVRKRTSEALLSLSSSSLVQKESQAEISITREDLAKMIGVATETAIRCLSDLKEDGLIEVRGRKILVKDVNGLKKLRW